MGANARAGSDTRSAFLPELCHLDRVLPIFRTQVFTQFLAIRFSYLNLTFFIFFYPFRSFRSLILLVLAAYQPFHLTSTTLSYYPSFALNVNLSSRFSSFVISLPNVPSIWGLHLDSHSHSPTCES